MDNWKNKLDIKKIWQKGKAGEATHQEIAAEISKQLKSISLMGFIPEYQREECNFLADEFELLSIDKNATVDEFDNLMSQLYDWGDHRHTCWIGTF